MSRAVSPWPWISPFAGAVAAVSPIGREFLWSAFVSSDQLGRNIARPLVFWAIGAVLVAVLCEYLLRRWLRED